MQITKWVDFKILIFWKICIYAIFKRLLTSPDFSFYTLRKRILETLAEAQENYSGLLFPNVVLYPDH